MGHFIGGVYNSQNETDTCDSYSSCFCTDILKIFLICNLCFVKICFENTIAFSVYAANFQLGGWGWVVIE